MKHALTFDVEEYFHVSAFADSISQASWGTMKSRLAATVDLTLELLRSRDMRATFFILGWVTEHDPSVVRRIAEAGHEIACHSHRHQQVFNLTPQQFREDSRLAKDALEQVSGVRVQGYRAPSFSITRQSMWALDILAELGFVYDSSIFPVRHPNYGIIDAPRSPFLVHTPSGPLVEFPMPVLTLGQRRAPFGGGAYMRLLPYRYTRWAMNAYARETGNAACVYAHPWELDPEQPRMSGRLTSRIRHYIGLKSMQGKLRRLIDEFDFTTLASLAPAVLEGAPAERQAAAAGVA